MITLLLGISLHIILNVTLVHVAIQITIRWVIVSSFNVRHLILTILLAVISSRNFTGCYNSHEVVSFVYLVVLCIKVRLRATSDCCFVLMKHLSSQLLSRKYKCLIYTTLVTPVLTLGSMVWTRG